MTDPRKPPLISVIIPALNEERAIGQLLDDLAPLRSIGHEVLLVDGGSHDRTREIAAGLVDRVIPGMRGRARQMNAGARMARGDILWFLHADTRVPAQAVGQILRCCANDELRWGRFDIRLSGRHWLLRIVEYMMNWRSALTGIATGDQGLFATRTLFDAVNGFPDIQLMEDIAICRSLRARARPARIRSPRLVASSRRWEQNGIVATILLMWRLRLAYATGTPPGELAKRYP